MSENKIKSSKNEVGYNSDSMYIEDQEENIFNSQGNLNSNENNQIFLDTQEISDQDCWKVISAYFSQHGLVSQQIDSFNQFVSKNIQEIIDENKVIKIEGDVNYKKGGEQKIYELNFNKMKKIENPQFKDNNTNKIHIIFPNEARARNLNYASDLKVDVTFKETKIKNGKETKKEETKTHFLGKIPIMVRSKYCSLYGKSDKDRISMKECEFDQGGYFIINGGEKVIVAQERMATNFVYVFNKKDQSGITWQAEIRSSCENYNQTPGLFAIKIIKKNTHNNKSQNLGDRITAKIPNVKSDIDIVILLRALGLENYKDIFDYIIYDEKDNAFQEFLRPSLEFISSNYKTKEECLEYIGRRSNGINKETRIKRAEEILRQNLLPHISTKEGDELKKAYFIGYMIYRLGNCVLGRASGDDRDHYGKKD